MVNIILLQYIREMHCHFAPGKEQEPHCGFQNYSISGFETLVPLSLCFLKE